MEINDSIDDRIAIEPLRPCHCDRLAEIIGTDEKLNHELTPSKPLAKTSADEYYNVCRQWEIKKNAVCYCILRGGIPIGSISISHRDFENKTAKCGYWLESSCWGKGYATKAFRLAINEARKMGFITLSCSILKNNLASVALWKRQGAILEEKDGRVIPYLPLQAMQQK